MRNKEKSVWLVCSEPERNLGLTCRWLTLQLVVPVNGQVFSNTAVYLKRVSHRQYIIFFLFCINEYLLSKDK